VKNYLGNRLGPLARPCPHRETEGPKRRGLARKLSIEEAFAIRERVPQHVGDSLLGGPAGDERDFYRSPRFVCPGGVQH
jgi:hypothetical protein